MTFPSPMPPSPQQSPREKYRTSLYRRQGLIYGTSIVTLVGLVVLAVLSLMGVVPSPFPEEFSKKTVYASPGEVPCPVNPNSVAGPEGVKLQVLNGSSIPGGAATLSKTLEEQGYEVTLTDNASLYRGTFQIQAGPQGVDNAYALARYFGDKARVRLTEVPGKTITITIGEAAEKLPSSAEITEIIDAQTPIPHFDQCIPLDPQALSDSRPISGDSDQSGQPAGQSQD